MLRSVFRPLIRSDHDLTRYVSTVSMLCVGAALALDIANQLTFFVDWGTCFRSWSLTACIALALSIPIARSIGAAHLQLSKAIAAAEALGRTDQLTGLPNRRALIERVSECGPEGLALVIVDIDWFKRVNDTHGHLTGDKVIQAVAAAMASELSGLGMVARIGGEEFAVLAQGEAARNMIGEIDCFREKLNTTPVIVGEVALRVTISAGVAFRTRDETFDHLFSQADEALYEAKRTGRNRVCVASETNSRAATGTDVRREPAARAGERRVRPG